MATGCEKTLSNGHMRQPKMNFPGSRALSVVAVAALAVRVAVAQSNCQSFCTAPCSELNGDVYANTTRPNLAEHLRAHSHPAYNTCQDERVRDLRQQLQMWTGCTKLRCSH